MAVDSDPVKNRDAAENTLAVLLRFETSTSTRPTPTIAVPIFSATLISATPSERPRSETVHPSGGSSPAMRPARSTRPRRSASGPPVRPVRRYPPRSRSPGPPGTAPLCPACTATASSNRPPAQSESWTRSRGQPLTGLRLEPADRVGLPAGTHLRELTGDRAHPDRLRADTRRGADRDRHMRRPAHQVPGLSLTHRDGDRPGPRQELQRHRVRIAGQVQA